MHRALCVCVSVYAAGREWEEAGKTQSDFSTPPSVFKGCRMGPRGCSAGDHVAPLSQTGCLTMPSCFAWGRLGGLWGNMPVSASRSTVLPALPSQPCTCSGAPLLGLCVAHGKAVWGLQWPRALPAHRCIRAERREGGEKRLRELLFSSLGHLLPFLCNRKRWV